MGSQNAFAPSVSLAMVFSSMVTTALVDAYVMRGGPAALASGLVSTTVMWAIFRLLAQVHKQIKEILLARVFALLAFLLTSASRGLTMYLLAEAVGYSHSPLLFPQHLFAVGEPIVLAMLLVATLAYRREEHLNLATKLQTENGHLLKESQEFENRIAGARENLEKQVAGQLTPAIDGIRQEVARFETASQAEIQAIVSALTNLVSNVVRPMSHSLALSEGEQPEATPLEARKVIKMKIFRAKFDTAKLVSLPVLGTVELLQALVFGPLVSVISAPIIGDLVATAIGGLVFAGAKYFWPKSLAKNSLLTSMATWSFLYVLAAVIPRVLLAAANPEIFANQFLDAHLIDRYFLFMGFIIAAAIEQLDSSADAQLNLVNIQLEKLVARQRRELANHRKNLSWLLHGPIQATLISAAIQLGRAANSNFNVIQFTSRIEEAVSQIESGWARHNDLDVALGEILGVWSGVLKFTTQVSPSAKTALVSDPALCGSVAELIREAVSNAYRHGAATEIVITLATEEPDLLLCRVANNGKNLDFVPEPGLGTALIDEMCWHWSLTPADGGGAELTSYFPLGEVPARFAVQI
ncbi:MAG: hypothetical protein RL196_753 [Actinomycetota bacterium]|jgi:hypothetical protein